MNFSCMPVSALEKLIGGKIPVLYENSAVVFQGERHGFQIAFKGEGRSFNCLRMEYDAGVVDAFRIIGVPCTTVNPEGSDDYSVVSLPAVIGDVLLPIGRAGIHADINYWNSLFIVTKRSLSVGTYRLRFVFFDGENEIGQCLYTVIVTDKALPESDLFVTHWLHADCIAETHRVRIFGEAFWRIFKKYLLTATEHGMTMLLVPAFTPPLDTKEGEERLTAQLVKVRERAGRYEFDFSLLGRYLDTAKKCGIRYFEFAPIVTQWGAKHAPKIVVTTDSGTEEKRFGWETDSTDDGYLCFLREYFCALRKFILGRKMIKNSFFHISDEPNAEAVGRYRVLRGVLKDCFPEAKVIDTVSEYEFYREAEIDLPVAALERADAFAEKSQNYMIYYCMAQRNEFVANSFLFTPPERVRILGLQLYLNGACGFLHWGYNYYKSGLSLENVNPYCVTDCGGCFQSGDAFLVYPGAKTVYSSLREEYLAEAVDDYRLCKLLEKKIGREAVCRLLSGCGMHGYKEYIHSAAWLSEVRRKLTDACLGNGADCQNSMI